MMREVLTRRLKEAQSNNPKFNTLPDLMLIDGGKGQLAVAVSVAAEMGLELNMIGLAKQFDWFISPASPTRWCCPAIPRRFSCYSVFVTKFTASPSPTTAPCAAKTPPCLS